jgi:hypothetical protein
MGTGIHLIPGKGEEADMATLLQRGWRFCSKCNGLFFSGGGTAGVCPVDQGPHDGSASGDYALWAEDQGTFNLEVK